MVISGRKKGCIPWNKGKKCPQLAGENSPTKRLDVRKKMSLASKGKPKSKEHRKKLSEAKIGKKLSEEHKRHISESELGEKNHSFGKKRSKECKKKMSESHKGTQCGKNSGRYGKPPKHSKGYYYDSPLQGMVWLRSSYEIGYAKYLDEHKILWMYEMETFDLGYRTYTPDFFLPQFEKFIDTKGYMRPESQEKINMFLEQYPWDLEILYKEDLIKLGIKL